MLLGAFEWGFFFVWKYYATPTFSICTVALPYVRERFHSNGISIRTNKRKIGDLVISRKLWGTVTTIWEPTFLITNCQEWCLTITNPILLPLQTFIFSTYWPLNPCQYLCTARSYGSHSNAKRYVRRNLYWINAPLECAQRHNKWWRIRITVRPVSYAHGFLCSIC